MRREGCTVNRKLVLVLSGSLAAAMVTSLITVTPVEAKPESSGHLVAQAEKLDKVGGEVKGTSDSTSFLATPPIPSRRGPFRCTVTKPSTVGN
jgi:hypothetical protein